MRKEYKRIIAKNIPFIFSMPALLWQFFFLYIPIFLMVYSSFTVQNAPWYMVTLDNYYILTAIPYIRIIARSTAIAFGVALLCLICAYPIAYYLALKVTQRWKNILLFLLTLPFWTNFLILVYSWFFVFDHTGLINSTLLFLGIIKEPLHLTHNVYAIILVMIHYYIPFMIMPLYSTLEKIQQEVQEASADLGATHWQTFTHITIPLSMTGIKTGFFLVFVPTFGDFVIPSMIGGARDLFVGSLISHYFLVAHDNGLGAAFTMISSIVLIISLLLISWLWRPSRSTSQKEHVL